MNFLYAKWILLSERYGTVPVYFNLNNVIFIDSKSCGEDFPAYLSQLEYAFSIWCAINGEHYPIQNVPFVCLINISDSSKAEVFPYSPFQIEENIISSSTSSGTMFPSNILKKEIGSQVTTSLDISYLQYKYIKEQIEEALKINVAMQCLSYLCNSNKANSNILFSFSLVSEIYHSVFEKTSSTLKVLSSTAVNKFQFYNSYKSQNTMVGVISNAQKVGQYNPNFSSITSQINTSVYVPTTVQNPVYFSINEKLSLDFVLNYLTFISVYGSSSNSQLNVSLNINGNSYAGSINSIENLVLIDYNIIGESLASNRQHVEPKISIEFDLKTNKVTLASLENMNENSLSYYDSKTIQEMYYL